MSDDGSLEDGLSELAPFQARVLRLIYFAGKNHAEIRGRVVGQCL